MSDGILGSPVVAILGPTGSGKSSLSVRLAERIGGEVVNYDSVQIVRDFDIGSAKPSRDERRGVPHHLFDRLDPTQPFDAAEFSRLALDVCREIESRGQVPILVGGTGFYLRAFLSGLPEMPARDETIRRRLRRIAIRARGPARLNAWLQRIDPASAARIAPTDRHRIERALEVWIASGRPISSWHAPSPSAPERIASVKLGLAPPRDELLERLDHRVEQMYEAGLVEETRALLARYRFSSRPFSTIGYREAVEVIQGAMSLDEAIAVTRRRTRAYAKRQMTWLRGERDVHWLSRWPVSAGLVEEVLEVLRSHPIRLDSVSCSRL